MKKRFNVLILAFAAVSCFANTSNPTKKKALDPHLSLERIFDSQEFTPEHFGPARWMKDGVSYTTLESSGSVKGAKDIILYSAVSGKRKILVPAHKLIPKDAATPLTIEDYNWSMDGKLLIVFTNSKRVWRRNTRGDFWILDLVSGKFRKLGADFELSTLQFAKISPSGQQAAYVQKNDLYSEDIASGKIVRLTFDGSETMINGTGDWVYEEELDIRDGFRWSPDGKFISFWQFDSSGIKDYFLINNTDSRYPGVMSIKYPKVGEMNSACRVGIVDALGSPVVWLKVAGDARDNYIARMFWTEDSQELVIEHLNRLQNTNQVLCGNALTGNVRPVFVDRDEAWVDVVNDFRWLENGSDFTWLSERDGWRHVYIVSRADGRARLVTPGAFDVISVEMIDAKGGWLYYMASPDNPTQRYLFRTRLDGQGKAERLTPYNQPGSHSYQVSPNGAWAIHSYSTFDSPAVTDLVRLPQHTSVRILASNQALIETIRALERKPTKFFRVDIGNGILLDGWSIKPPDFDPAKAYPLFIHIYGEPAGQTVLDRWGRKTYLWHLMLAQQGYIVVSIDPRGTPAPRGREWRKCVYRKVGIIAPADHAAAVKALMVQKPYLDSSRVGIWGWSGGGQMTLNAMFKYPDLYKTGMAVAFVSDQRLYDTIYQERFMGLPKDNEEGYREGSPINFAKDLKGNLLIVHGTGDDNVHYQNFEQLVNELIANNKLFTMMAYPNRSHGIYEGKGTTLHLYETLTNFLNLHMPPGPRTTK
ncbi:MAG TPA: S9 family peptidase [Patescibacteria group bacterium]|nr:S9 family peptidase [Patescibacteria group bacterium]